LLPNVSAISDALSSCIKIVFPIAMLAFVNALYAKKKKNAKEKKGGFIATVGTVLTVVLIVSVAMLISCQFRFGALVIATESMTGEINKGDMIIYEQYDDQKIEEGQVIVFSDGQSKIIHRVIKIENIEGERRYYTKGDANETPDFGYRTEADIVGLTDVKVPYVGFPTLWLREIITN
jgi:signal peptidase